ncbi:hypothetical protein R5R35_005199 [Gryllus longicercus]|uniref:Accessory gland protein n=1 Tax=Gryllus longicercus TaxID=2509291 RepID=A0AAN9VXF2_9ORTH
MQVQCVLLFAVALAQGDKLLEIRKCCGALEMLSVKTPPGCPPPPPPPRAGSHRGSSAGRPMAESLASARPLARPRGGDAAAPPGEYETGAVAAGCVDGREIVRES